MIACSLTRWIEQQPHQPDIWANEHCTCTVPALSALKILNLVTRTPSPCPSVAVPPTGCHAGTQEVGEIMENGSGQQRWKFKANEVYTTSSATSVRGVLGLLMNSLSKDDPRPVIPLGHGDPSAFPSFRTSPVAEDAIFDSVHSAKFNGYSAPVGILPARR